MENQKVIVGYELLKDEFRKAKVKVGDLRGLKNAFQLAAKFGLNEMEVAFFKCGGLAGLRMEVYASIMPVGSTSLSSYWCYSMRDMIEELKSNSENEFEIEIYYCKWNKERTDADRIRVTQEFIFKKE